MQHIYSTELKGCPVLHFLGRINSADAIEEMFFEIAGRYNIKKSNESDINELLIDLTNAEIITDDCLTLFQRLRKEYSIKFINYSLYLELLLSQYNLIDKNGE